MLWPRAQNQILLYGPLRRSCMSYSGEPNLALWSIAQILHYVLSRRTKPYTMVYCADPAFCLIAENQTPLWSKRQILRSGLNGEPNPALWTIMQNQILLST